MISPKSVIGGLYESLIDIFKPMLLIVHLKNQEVGVDVAAKRVIRIKAQPDFDRLFQLLNGLLVDKQRRSTSEIAQLPLGESPLLPITAPDP